MIPDTTSSSAAPTSDEVVCRRTWADWLGAAMLSCLGLSILALALLPSKATTTDRISAGILALPWLAGAVACALLGIRGYLIAGEAGLRWRALGRERSVRWDQITDYYFEPASGKPWAIETPAGKLNLSSWSNIESLKAVVAARALDAKSKSWDLRGIRPEDEWPLTFRYTYDSRAIRVTEIVALWFFTIFPLCGLLFLLTQLSLPSVVRTLESMWLYNGPAATIIMLAVLGLPTIFIFAVFPILWAYVVIGMWREIRTRPDDELIATPYELTLNQNSESRTIRWIEVTDYLIARPHLTKAANVYRVETEHDAIEWTGSLINNFTLRRIAKRYATGAASKDWDTLDSKSSKQQIRQSFDETGTRKFTYRTESVRLWLWGLSASCLLPAVLCIVLPPGSIEPGDTRVPSLPPGPFCYALALIPLWAVWLYYASSITVTPQGIVQKGALRKRFLAWDEVTMFESTPKAFFSRVRGGNAVITFMRGLDDIEDLRAVVNERVAAKDIL